MAAPDKKPGRPTKITTELVARVSARVATGIPIKLALAGEPVSQDTYERHLRRHPELSALQEKAKREFLEFAIHELVHRKQLPTGICWLLERRHSDLFGRQPAPTQTTNVTVQQSVEVAGMSAEILERARKYAQAKTPVS